MCRLRAFVAVLTLLCTYPVAAVDASRVAPSIVLAEIYRANINPADYLISEKYDGVRAIWDGRELRFRSGNRVNAPDWFVASLPSEALDGELWLGRGKFAELSGIVRKAEPVDAEWRQIRYMIFELPGAKGTFSERAERIATLVASRNVSWLEAVTQSPVADIAELMRRFKHVTRDGGEGVMLHRADALYVTGRSDVLLKLKPLQDAEATVLGYAPGRGRHQGVVGALKVESANGTRFRIGSGLSDADRRHPPAVGSLVTYRYQELTSRGVPRFPRFWRVRESF